MIVNQFSLATSKEEQINMEDVIYNVSNLTYSRYYQDTSYTLSYLENQLEKDIDYTVSGTTRALNAGTYTITFIGKGKYTGTKNVTWKMNPYNIANLTGSGTTNFTYNGSTQTTSYTLSKHNGYSLVKDTDYTVSGTSAINAGSYYIYCSGKGNYTGTKNISWKIDQLKVYLSSVTASTYTISRSAYTTITFYGVISTSITGNVSLGYHSAPTGVKWTFKSKTNSNTNPSITANIKYEGTGDSTYINFKITDPNTQKNYTNGNTIKVNFTVVD